MEDERIARIAKMIKTRGQPGPLYELQKACAVDFGLARGWKLSWTEFGPKTLSQRRHHVIVNTPMGLREYQWPREYADHGNYYRRDRRAIGMVAHLYHVPDDIHDWAAANGLTVEVRSGDESWYYPGSTTLVVWSARA